jgi:nitrite reductase/ring-hydroxylating ferredoxin subunit/uncharacterized membrane protein
MRERARQRAGDVLVAAIERQAWIDRLAGPLGDTIQGAFRSAGRAGQGLASVLHGTWLGHPLHPALTDIPLGAWTVTVVLDAVDGAKGRRPGASGHGADAALGVGIAGAVGAAVTGLADWQHTDGAARRLGLAHGLLNGAALLLMVGSLALRRSGARRQGRLVAALGYAIGATSAYLGGHLVYRQRLGTDHSQMAEGPEGFAAAARLDELADGKPRRVEVNGTRILLVRRGDQVAALNEVCTHLGGPLAEGEVEAGSIVCPWHGSRFALEDGQVLGGPATAPQPCYETRLRDDGVIEVAVRGSHAG